MAFITIDTEDGKHTLNTAIVHEIKASRTDSGARLMISFENGTKAIYKDFETIEEANEYHNGLLNTSNPNYFVGLSLDPGTLELRKDLENEEAKSLEEVDKPEEKTKPKKTKNKKEEKASE